MKKSDSLPSPLEYANIRTSLNSQTCTRKEKSFLSASDRFYLTRALFAMLATLGVAYGISAILKSADRARVQIGFNSLMTGSPEEVDARLDLMDQFDRSSIMPLIAAGTETSQARARLHALLAQSRFGHPEDIPTEEILELVANAEPGECKNILNALGGVQSESKKNELANSIFRRYSNAQNIKTRARLAILGLYLGFPEAMESVLTSRENLIVRSNVLENHLKWHGNITTLIEHYSEPTPLHSSLQSMICFFIGQLADNAVTESGEKLTDFLKIRLGSSPFQDVHAAAFWALNQIGESDFETGQAPLGNNWFYESVDCPARENTEQITFVLVEPRDVYRFHGMKILKKGQEPVVANLDHSFFHFGERSISQYFS